MAVPGQAVQSGNVISPQYIFDCVKQNELLELDDYRLVALHAAHAQVALVLCQSSVRLILFRLKKGEIAPENVGFDKKLAQPQPQSEPVIVTLETGRKG